MATSDSKIFCGGLSYQTTDYSLAVHFGNYGQVTEAKIVYDRNTGTSKGYGFVTFALPASATAACQNPNPTIDGKQVNVNLASAKSQPNTPAASNAAPEPAYLDTLRAGGEDISPEVVEAAIQHKYTTNPIDALMFFLERAELFRGLPEFDYYKDNLIAGVRVFRAGGTINPLPAKTTA
eukprot:TRINITY_DN2671_c0_g2_i2.p1 TRINITY_DN2671_c0_g2~~TRINITY_DN2671_c0_g2_i2.p1  ORF type:complete len:179 (-),score=46.85 TRINITY_DN2671_c0_g2_i2:285-821(-)